MGEVLEVMLKVQDGASVPLKAAGDAAGRAAPQIAALRREMGSVTPGMASMSTGARQASQGLQSIALQVPDVITQLSMGVPAARVFAIQGLQVLQVNMGLVTTALKSMIGVMGPALIAVAAAATAYSIWGNATADARVRAQGLTAEVERLQKGINPRILKEAEQATKAWSDAMADLDVQLLLATGDLTEFEAKALDRIATLEKESEALRYKAGMEVANAIALQMSLEAEQAAEKIGTDRWVDLQKRINTLDATIKTRREHLAAVEAENAAAMDRLQNRLLDIAQEKARLDTEKHTKAIQEQTVALESQRDMLAEITAMSGKVPVQTDAVGTSAFWANRQSQQADAQAAAARQAIETEMRTQTMWQGASLGSAVAGGSLSSIVAAIGGPAAIAATAASALEQLGDVGAKGISKGWQSQISNMAKGIEELAPLLAKAIPDAVEAIITKLPAAIIENLPDILLAVVKENVALMWDWFVTLPVSFAQALFDALTKWWRDAKEAITNPGEWASNAWEKVKGWGRSAWEATGGKVFAEGSQFVDRTQLALVHQGEEIVPEGGRSQRGMSRGGVTINISGFVGPEALDELDRMMRIHTGRGLTFGYEG